MQPTKPVSMEAVQAARERLKGVILRTPLVPLQVYETDAEIYLKMENLQITGAFKVRGAGNAMLSAQAEDLRQGVWTASAGNMAQAVAWHARRLNVPCSVIVPHGAPQTKLNAIERLGARITVLPQDEYWDIQRSHSYAQAKGLFVHPFQDPAVMAGNATLALEILEDLPDVEAVIAPYGGGGLSCGIASAMRALKPTVRVYASEVDTAAPLAASLAAECPTDVTYHPSFVSGIGAPFLFPGMWPLAQELLEGSLVASLDQTVAAVKLLVERNRVVAEGAAATAVAAALHHKLGARKVVCVLSGGNLGTEELMRILQGEIP